MIPVILKTSIKLYTSTSICIIYMCFMSKNVFLYAAFKQCCNMYHKRNRVGLSSEIVIS